MVNEVTGLRTIFRKTARDTNGALLQVDWIGKPGWVAGGRHVHPRQEERFTVISGTLGSHVDGVERMHGPGEVIAVPADAVHTVWAVGDEGVHALVEFRPALRSETVLEILAGLAREGKTDAAGNIKNPLLAAVLLREYADEIYPASPPLIVQRAIIGMLAAIGRLLGYRAAYPTPDEGRREASPSGR